MRPGRYAIHSHSGPATIPYIPPQRDQTSSIPHGDDSADDGSDMEQSGSCRGGNQGSSSPGWNFGEGSSRNGSQQNPYRQSPHQQSPYQQSPRQWGPHQQGSNDGYYRSLLELCETAKDTIMTRYRQGQAHIQCLNQDLLLGAEHFHKVEDEANYWKQKCYEKEREINQVREKWRQTAIFAQTMSTWAPGRHHALEKISNDLEETYKRLKNSVDAIMAHCEVDILGKDTTGQNSGKLTNDLHQLYLLCDQMMTETGHYRALEKWLREPPWLRGDI
ncbi:hypothetical protein F5B22DRAFT_35156 [Xylaria bambusicola]|uniref:uncharacterized protein n=1 Tax=Xylaria bambusicola TaxID=326684 RepID=UPI002007E983|nr:uncharacterized protein F5B22DRAFT_35156 [Xylaria bambusicola]KAI0521030.1 hypothetical protein F5B22DRAFT_35156 [Xylaria bambusicola]